MKKYSLFYVLIVTAISLLAMCGVSCNSHSKEIEKMTNDLLNSPISSQGEEGSWVMEYEYDFLDDIKLGCREHLSLYKNGKFKELTEYYYSGQLMATCEFTGEWSVKYDNDYGTFFFDQDYEDDMIIKNINFQDDWFKKFDTDLRLTRNGDVNTYNDYDENTVFGNEIIDCSPNILLLKDLANDETYRYEPDVKYL